MRAVYIICGIIILIYGILILSGNMEMSPGTYGSWISCYGIFAILIGLTSGGK